MTYTPPKNVVRSPWSDDMATIKNHAAVVQKHTAEAGPDGPKLKMKYRVKKDAFKSP